MITVNLEILSDLMDTKTGHRLLWFLLVGVWSEAIPHPEDDDLMVSETVRLSQSGTGERL